MKTLQKLSIPMLAVLSLIGCKSVPSSTSDYRIAKQNIQGVTLDQTQATRIGTNFVATFNTLGTPSFIKNVDQMYADRLFINDTLSQFNHKTALMQHFKGMNQRVSNVNVQLVSATYHQDSAYVHWYMAYDFKIFGKNKTMQSYGMSEIKVNPAQQIIFQQDYWDPTNGLYRSLPYVGGVYSWLLPFKKSH